MLCSGVLDLGDVFLVDDSVCETMAFDEMNDLVMAAKAAPLF